MTRLPIWMVMGLRRRRERVGLPMRGTFHLDFGRTPFPRGSVALQKSVYQFTGAVHRG